MIIRRRFANISDGQIHYYTANEEAKNNEFNPVILLTASPFSARVLSPIITEVSNTRWCVAPDHLGQGDSCSPLNQSPDIEYFGKKLIEFLDNLEISKADFYGTHTGAHFAMEIGIKYPDRIGKLILDGIGIPSEDLKIKYIDNLLKPVPIDLNGSQWLWAFQTIKDMYCFFPYFERDSLHRRIRDLPSIDELHDRTMDLLKNISSYHLAYIAAFRNNANGELFPLIQVPTLLTGASKDVSIDAFSRVAKLIPDCDAIPYPENIEPGDVQPVAEFLCSWLDKG